MKFATLIVSLLIAREAGSASATGSGNATVTIRFEATCVPETRLVLDIHQVGDMRSVIARYDMIHVEDARTSVMETWLGREVEASFALVGK